MLQRYRKFVVLGSSGYLAMHTQSDTINLLKMFVFYLQTKNQFHTPCFSGDTANICKLIILGTLGMPGYTQPK